MSSTPKIFPSQALTRSYVSSEEAERAIALRAGGRRSTALRRIVERYDFLCRESFPPVSETELKLITEAINPKGTLEIEDVLKIPSTVSEAIRFKKIHRKHNVLPERILGKLQGFKIYQLIALADRIERQKGV